MPTLTSFLPIVRQQHQFTFGDHLGSIAAQQDLLLQAIHFDQASTVNVITGSSLALGLGGAAIWKHSEDTQHHLAPAVASRIQNLTFGEALEGNRLGATVFISRVQDFPNFSVLRQHLPDPSPICALVHSVLTPELYLKWLTVGLTSENWDYVVVTSSASEHALAKLREQMEEAFPRVGGFHWPSVRRIPLGVDEQLADLKLDQGGAREALGLPHSGQILLYNGRLSEEYKADLEPLITVFHRIQRRFPALLLCIAGHESTLDYSARLSRFAEQHRVRSKICFIVNYPRHLKRILYRAADIFVSPVDNVQETFGLSLLEAMASGLPIVASDWSGYRDIVEDGVTGFLVRTAVDWSESALADVTACCCPVPVTEQALARGTVIDLEEMEARLVRLLESRDMCLSFGERGRQRVQENFLWCDIIRRYGDLWNEQREICGAVESRRRDPGHVADIFAGYGSMQLEEKEAQVLSSPEDLGRFQSMYGKSDARYPILGYCLCAQNFSGVLQRFGSGARPALVNLMKKGFLRFVGAPPH